MMNNKHFKVGLSRVDCEAWKNQELFGFNSAVHDSVNSINCGCDLGHVIDKIVERKRNITTTDD